jgi:hypothetical protein
MLGGAAHVDGQAKDDLTQAEYIDFPPNDFL